MNLCLLFTFHCLRFSDFQISTSKVKEKRINSFHAELYLSFHSCCRCWHLRFVTSFFFFCHCHFLLPLISKVTILTMLSQAMFDTQSPPSNDLSTQPFSTFKTTFYIDFFLSIFAVEFFFFWFAFKHIQIFHCPCVVLAYIHSF